MGRRDLPGIEIWQVGRAVTIIISREKHRRKLWKTTAEKAGAMRDQALVGVEIRCCVRERALFHECVGPGSVGIHPR